MFQRYLKWILILGVVNSVSFNIVFAKEFELDDVVAIVDGEKIYYRDIKYSAEVLIDRGIPQSQISKIKKQKEKNKLERRIEEILLYREARRRNIVITKEDAIEWAKKHYPDEAIEGSKKGYAILEMIKEIYRNPDKKEEIIEKIVKKFADSKTNEQYIRKGIEQVLRLHKRIENIERLQKDLCLSKEEVYKRVMYPDPYTGYHFQVIYEKLWDQVTKDIFVSDEEVEKMFNKKYPRDKIKEMGIKETEKDVLKKMIRIELLQRKKNDAWNRFYDQIRKKANIKIIYK